MTASVATTSAFWRTYRISIDQANGESLVFTNADAANAQIRASFSIERNYGGPGVYSLQLTNLSPAHIASLKKGQRVSIAAGYGLGLRTIGIGNIVRLRTQRGGPDVTTSVDMLSSESLSVDCVISRSYAPSEAATTGRGGARLATILQDIVDAMRVAYNPAQAVAVKKGVFATLPNFSYPLGYTLNGTCGQELNKLLRPLGYTWTLDNGVLSIIKNGGYDLRPVVTLSPETGLINSPSIEEHGYVQFQALMNPFLRPAGLVQLQAGKYIALSGPSYYLVRRTVHTGDTHGGSWHVDCEASVFDGIIAGVGAG